MRAGFSSEWPWVMVSSVMAATVPERRGGSITSGVIPTATRVAYRPPMASAPPVGVLLRDWRQRRRLSRLDLALEAGVSSRHLSFVETGRSRPSPEMVLHLADELELPLRERNRLLLAAG